MTHLLQICGDWLGSWVGGWPLLGLLALSLVMAGAWFHQRRTGNAGIVDVLWAAGIGGLALLYAITADGWLPRRVLVATLACGWSARLTFHLAQRYASEPEDGRYARLREELGSGVDRWMFVFFQAQAWIATLASIAFLIPASTARVGFDLRDVAAVLVWVLSLAGESVADRQLRVWRADPANRGRTCRTGLWRYSRHPNYFFEWVHWMSYPLLALGAPLGWVTWLVPLLMLVLILKVTGIPPTEARALESRGDEYRDYQRTTNAFFPGPPRARSLPHPSAPRSRTTS